MDITTQALSQAQNTFTTQQVEKSHDAFKQTMNDDQIRQAAEKFEGMFMAQMLGQMFEQLPTDGYFSGGSQEKMFQSFMVEEYGNLITQRGGIGLADDIQRQMIMMQEGK